MNQLKQVAYRPDIDGMRAIAVLSVVLFHIKKSLMPGGYAGVDIFFVISGYLITLLIYGQITAGTFTFSDFYKRRINRIAPALFVLIAGVSAIGLFILSPADLTRTFKSATYSSVGLSNIFFWREYGSYFSSGIDEAPLLHTWSLSVEEQFYVIWPLILLIVARLRPAYRNSVIGIGVFAALVLSELGTRNAASASYYLLPTRFFELLIGGALAIYFFHRKAPLGERMSNILGASGLVLTFGSLYFLNEKVSFPGLNALYPCMGAAFLIAAGENTNSLTARLLAFKPLVSVGLISYSFYLWHWPLIAFTHYLGIPIDVLTGTALFLLSMGLGWASWKFVELPFRRSGGTMLFRSVVGYRYLVPVAAIVLAFVGVSQSQGVPGRFDPRVPQYERIIATAPNELRPECHSSTFFYDRKPAASCLLGAPNKEPEVLLIGDSFANHFTGMIDILAKNDQVAVRDYTMDGCLPVKGMGFGAQESYARKCKARNNFAYDYISASKYKYVILAGSWPVTGTREEFAALGKGLDDAISTVIAAGAKPIIILANESTGNANCPVRRLLSRSTANCDKKQEAHQIRDDLFAELKVKFPEISFVDPNQAICDGGICHSMLEGTPLYRDGDHLNDVGSRVIGQALVEKNVHLVARRDFVTAQQ